MVCGVVVCFFNAERTECTDSASGEIVPDQGQGRHGNKNKMATCPAKQRGKKVAATKKDRRHKEEDRDKTAATKSKSETKTNREAKDE
jgi:hypothetical protein